MGNCLMFAPPDIREKSKRSKEVDAFLRTHGKITREEIKLLLLGPGESGKSTIFKQMKLLTLGGGFTDEELASFRHIIYSNCISQMKVLVQNAEKLEIDYELPENEERGERIKNTSSTGETWTQETADDIRHLWNDSGVQKVYDERDKKFQLNDSANYFFNDIERIGENSYLPTNQDVLRCRVRSTGIDEAEFELDGLEFKMLDVGGQRSERRKWIHCFDCVTAILFCASLSEYDQVLREDDTQNRMKESILLFDEICNSPWFRDTTFMLFLNKTDLFREKIPRVPLTVCFPDFKGESNYEQGTSFIKQQFFETRNFNQKIYHHYTCAISTENVKFVFGAVKDILLDDTISAFVL
eukprot:CAMPEP_0117028672 /NCGR_PEP_ID=MMETSP0472-20121206/20832_1 /TAXON_ID=693140 ORGANISM="Tiarina fusus, Strain LIS" /NCGR_SAMPLE_ID=MMETSP0472 /ASSEMBLY_ACC=CAM_ASM_000603 /LENGTH=354 /DNA_ID=CAMNT_0004736235 /DNA_START=8 /DNA_END=1072 /DNA_ORIENTATION=+